MKYRSKTVVRACFVVLLSVSLLTIGSAYASVLGGTAGEAAATAEERYTANSTEPVVESSEGITVVTTDSNAWLGRESDDPRSKAEIVAFDPNGSVRYYNDTHTRYWDVDSVPGTKATVEYLYADHLNGSWCPDFSSPSYYNRSEYAQTVNRSTWQEYVQVQEPVGACTRNGIERVNLTTGERTTIYTQITPGKAETRWHDADRINASTYAVSDIFLDQTFVLDVRTGNITWAWSVDEEFSQNSSGGPYPDDWTHTNDIEVLPDGRLMLDLRNQDQVVFLEPDVPSGKALQENWTLGQENNYSILYEQHNPDYILPRNGGPAVAVADSENNRVVEYQRVNGSWKRTWIWTDARMQWPRDADRLPNGHALITDTNGDRILEVNQQGAIVWSANIGMPYEAERLGTGDESRSGPSARAANLNTEGAGTGKAGNVDAGNDGIADQEWIENIWLCLRGTLSGPAFSGLMYVLPIWMGVTELGAVLLFVLSVFCWLLIEAWWARYPHRLAAQVQRG